MDITSAHALRFIIPLLIVVLVLRRNLRARSLRMERMWIYPAILVAGALGPMQSEPFPGVVPLAGFAVALAVGGAIGWWRGRLTSISIDPTTHEFTSQGSVAGVILIGVVFALRYGISMAKASGPVELPFGEHLDWAGVTQGLTFFAVGTVTAQRIEMFLRCQRLLAEARSRAAA